ncbi:LysR family transcriptional regulator [Paenibacillus haidiansis]|uniref:LysR family transcriptional regulator n=1 Tax=Paenibacillus haidiansis TaxID=1574488 RepID=UPI0039E0548B
MDFFQLEAFLAVCQTLNFTKAAEHLHISQSAVTARIKSLENPWEKLYCCGITGMSVSLRRGLPFFRTRNEWSGCFRKAG